MSKTAGPPGWRRMTAVIVAALLVPIVPFVVIGELPGERWLSNAGEEALVFGAMGGGLLASDILLPVPSSIVGTLLGARLGFWPGWAWAWAGLLLGHVVGYGVGRLVPRRLVGDLPQTPTLLAVVLARPVPVVAEAVAIAAGAGRMPFGPYMVASVVTNGLYAGALAGNGAALLPDAFAGPGLVLPLLLPVVGWLVWRWHARRAKARGG